MQYRSVGSKDIAKDRKTEARIFQGRSRYTPGTVGNYCTALSGKGRLPELALFFF